MAQSIYLVHGEDEYLVSAKAKELVKTLVPEGDETFGLETVDGRADTVDSAVAAVGQVLQSLQTASFFSTERLLWFRDVSFLTDNVVGKSTTVKDKVGQLAEAIKAGLMDGQRLLVSAGKVNKKYAFYKACKANGEVVEFAVSEKSYSAEKDAATRLRAMASDMGLRLSEDAQDAFLGRAGFETRQIVNELEKLSIYLGGRKTVERSDVEAIVCGSRSVLAWDLADAVGRRDTQKALQVLRQLLFQKESPIGLIIGLESRVRDLMLYRQALEEGWLVRRSGGRGGSGYQWGRVPPDVDALLSDTLSRDPRKTHPFRVSLLAEQARRFSRAQLRACRQAVLDAHEQIVSTAMPAPIVLELLIIRMLADARPAALA